MQRQRDAELQSSLQSAIADAVSLEKTRSDTMQIEFQQLQSQYASLVLESAQLKSQLRQSQSKLQDVQRDADKLNDEHRTQLESLRNDLNRSRTEADRVRQAMRETKDRMQQCEQRVIELEDALQKRELRVQSLQRALNSKDALVTELKSRAEAERSHTDVRRFFLGEFPHLSELSSQSRIRMLSVCAN